MSAVSGFGVGGWMVAGGTLAGAVSSIRTHFFPGGASCWVLWLGSADTCVVDTGVVDTGVIGMGAPRFFLLLFRF